MFLKNKNIIFKIRRSKVTDYAALRIDKCLCPPKLKSITVLLYYFSFKNENFATFTFVVKGMFNLHSKTSKDILTNFSNCY